MLFAASPKKTRLPPKEWVKSIESTMPTKTTVEAPKRKILLFSLATGYKHYVIPYVDEMMKMVCERTKAFDLTVSTDIEDFSSEKLKQYDAILLNNTCSIGKDRNLFKDVLINKVEVYGQKYKDLPLAEREAKVIQLEQNLLNAIESGTGLMVLHGAINILNKSDKVSAMVGGSFDYHPKFQKIYLDLMEKDHPLLRAFKGEQVVYEDEPYILNRAYANFNFRPLLRMDTNKLVKIKDSVKEMPRYMAWIKKYGEGRVLFSSPGHSHTTYENPRFIEFYLDGLQYVCGDLKCDDSVPSQIK